MEGPAVCVEGYSEWQPSRCESIFGGRCGRSVQLVAGGRERLAGPMFRHRATKGFLGQEVPNVKSVGHRQATSVDWLAPCATPRRLRLGVALGLATLHCELVFGQACR